MVHSSYIYIYIYKAMSKFQTKPGHLKRQKKKRKKRRSEQKKCQTVSFAVSP